MATAANTKGKKVVRKRRERKNVEKGQVHIRSSFNKIGRASCRERV